MVLEKGSDSEVQSLLSLFGILRVMLFYFLNGGGVGGNHYYTKHIRLQAQIHYEEMLIPWRFIQRMYWQTSCVACFIQRFYYIIMYRCHLLHCWWPVIGQVFTDHTCLYKQIMSQRSRLQILWDNMSNWKIKHYSPFKVLDITVSVS